MIIILGVVLGMEIKVGSVRWIEFMREFFSQIINETEEDVMAKKVNLNE